MSVIPKALVRDACAGILQIAGLSSYRRRRPGELLILMFHRVLPDALRALYPLPGLAVTPEELRWILIELQPYFQFGTVSALSRLQQRNEAQRPTLAVSFDDGQWDNVAYAAPVLRELGVPATFYLPTDFMGGTQLLWHDRAAYAWTNAQMEPAERRAVLLQLGEDDVRDVTRPDEFLAALKRVPPAQRLQVVDNMITRSSVLPPEWARIMQWQDAGALRDAGHEIGSHACSHGLLPQLDTEQQRRELANSSRAIEEAIGERPTSLCYPNGSFDQRSVALASETGYENSVTTRWGINSAKQPRMELLRCDMDARRLIDRSGRLSGARMAMRLSGLQPGIHQ